MKRYKLVDVVCPTCQQTYRIREGASSFPQKCSKPACRNGGPLVPIVTR